MDDTPKTDAIGIDHSTATEREYRLRKLCREFERALRDIANMPKHDQDDQIDMMDANEVRSELRKMLAALHEIARYDKDSKYGQGICPYGCDCPHIAQTALGANAQLGDAKRSL